jgi:hypothetical protein
MAEVAYVELLSHGLMGPFVLSIKRACLVYFIFSYLHTCHCGQIPQLLLVGVDPYRIM